MIRFIIFPILLFTAVVRAQDIVPVNDVRFRHFQLKDGLPSLMVERIIEDNHGFIWIGTYSGLVRYDGEIFEKILPGKIGAILEDKDGYIWAGTEKDLLRYDPRTGQSKSFYYKEKGPPKNRYDIISLEQDKYGNICIGTQDNGFVRLDPIGKDSFKIKISPSSPNPKLKKRHILQDTVPGGWLWSMLKDTAGTVWLGTSSGLVEVIPSKENPKFKYHSPDFEPFDTDTNWDIADLALGRNGKIWMVGWYDYETAIKKNYIMQFDPPTGKFVHYQADQNPNIYYRYILETDEGELWCGPHRHALQRIKLNEIDSVNINLKKINRIKHFPLAPKASFLSVDNCQGLLEDRSGAIWTLSNFEGVFQYQPIINRVKFYPLRQKKDDLLEGISKLVVTSDHQIIATAWGLGVFSCNLSGEGCQPIPIKFQSELIDVYKDYKRRIWITTGDFEISEYDTKHNRIVSYSILPQDQLRKRGRNYMGGISEDINGNFWVGSNGYGLIYFNPNSKKLIQRFTNDVHKKNWIRSDQIMATAIDNEDNVWIGSVYNGLFKLSSCYLQDSFHFEQFLTDVPGIFQPFFDSKGRFWLVTLANGLIQFDPIRKQVLHKFTMENGLSTNNLGSISEDSKGMLWLTTAKGITKIDPELQEATNYGDRYDLNMSQRNPNGGIITKDDLFVFGGEGGVYSLDLNSKENQEIKVPALVFKNLNINNQPWLSKNESSAVINYQKNISLAHHENNMEITYAGIFNADPDALEYEYKLEGYHRDWQKAGKERTARMANIPPGNYSFILRAIYGTQTSEKKLHINIAAPWYWNNLSKSVYAFLALGFLGTFLRYRHRMQSEKLEKDKVKQLNLMRSRFFANISHEFRTPLTLLQGPIDDQIAIENNEKKRSQLNLMRKQTTSMLQLVDELLELSKIDMDQLQLQIGAYNIFRYIRSWVESFSSYALQHNIDIVTDMNDSGTVVKCDIRQIERIIINLLSNAFKYCNQKVSFHSEYKNSIFYFDATNDGDPIPPEEVDHVFDQFYQASNAARQGSGVGLALVYQLTELMSGKIAVTSTKEGTTFRLQIPMERAILSNDKITGDLQLAAPIVETIKIPADVNETHDMELLIVEDSSDVRAYIRDVLHRNYNLIEARDGREGWQLATTHIPDLIISDVMMPHMDGIELCAQLKSDARTDHIPIILLTAKADIESRLEGLESGADDYLSKPFNSQELLTRINNLITIRNKLKEKFKTSITSDLPDISSADERFVSQAITVANEHLDDPKYSIEIFASDMQLSRAHFHKKLKSITGQSPSEFLRNIRLQRAAELLQAKHDSVSQIAYMVGFNNLSYFAKCFKEKYGVRPSEYGY